jgi:hypothetical protein
MSWRMAAEVRRLDATGEGLSILDGGALTCWKRV